MAKLIVTNQPVLRVGTDCSGIEAPIQALRQLAIPFKHVWSCEIDDYCEESIKANYYPQKFYKDITKRDVNELPDIDLYVCGFPCQPFSNAGKRKGFDHEKGNIFWRCLDVIKTKKPKYFLLENVRGLTWHDKGRTWNVICDALNSLSNYKFIWKVLNTRKFGIPQNRERIYMIGIRKDVKKEFIWPEPSNMRLIQNYVDISVTKKDTVRPDVVKADMLNRIPKDAVFVDFSFKKHNYPNSNKYCPTVAADSRLWCVPMGRYATPGERLALQGFQSFFVSDKVSSRQVNKQAGNSMSVNVIALLLQAMIE